MNIGFDFDKVFIDYPPFIPDWLVDFIYKSITFKINRGKNKLSYRFPGNFEKKIRLFSHQPQFRHPISNNINALQKIARKKGINVFLVSSRYSFLKKTTENLLKQNDLKKYFKGIHFNFENKQPHQFKEEIIKKLKIEKYIDDDLDLAIYLSEKLPKLRVYWLNKQKKGRQLPNNIISIKDVDEFLEKYL